MLQRFMLDLENRCKQFDHKVPVCSFLFFFLELNPLTKVSVGTWLKAGRELGPRSVPLLSLSLSREMFFFFL